ncbi:DMT family transporter [Flavobacterium sp. P4023]|uniref:DMT family transporter n=1 Tax=Flavobacterium flabelliforme TaxID=2816119 RepID=A0ABS5CSG8_9FLAO|nr:DMT family transporter [Flavobacterium flabelliforme]MBP4141563.1 DMT family transporter [Flavobacterium flabelliforme]
MSKTTKGILFALLATFLWSVNMVIASGVKEHIPPIGLVFWRWTVACVVLTPLALRATIIDFKIIKKHIKYLLLTAILGISIFNTLIYFAGKTTSAFNLSLMAISIPLFIIGISRIVFKEKVSNLAIAGIITIITGVLVLISKGSLDALLRINFAFGDLLMLLACFFFACYTLLVRKKPKELEPKVFLYSVFVIGTLILLPFYLWENTYLEKVVIDSKTLLIISYVGIFASLVSFYLWNEAIGLIGTSKTAVIYYLIPIFSGILAYFFLGQSIEFIQIISMAIIVLGLIITNKK